MKCKKKHTLQDTSNTGTEAQKVARGAAADAEVTKLVREITFE